MGAQPGVQLGQPDRFGQVVVRAGLQPHHDVHLGGARSQHDQDGAGELGESVYGEKADESPPVGEGIIIGLFKAIANACVL